MDTPTPVNLDRLKGILGSAKKLMTKVESGDFETGNIDSRALTEEGINDIMAEGGGAPIKQRPMATNQVEPEITREMISKSRMPESIKKAMIENPIPKMISPSHTFTLDDVSDFASDEKPMRLPQVNQRIQSKPVVNENRIQSMVGLNESEVRAIVKDEMIEFLTKYFTKSLTEDVQNKVIKQLLESGSIRVKK